jgi:cysteinyl-tRNA synthetase
MDDDINTPQALAVIHGTVRDGNAALASGDMESVRNALESAIAMLDVLGLNPADWEASGSDELLTDAVDGLVRVALEQRQAARERKDFAAADAIRDRLTAMGIAIEDTPDGPRWSLLRAGDDGR